MKRGRTRAGFLACAYAALSVLVPFSAPAVDNSGKKSPVDTSSPLYQEGQGRFVRECSSCHGTKADGDGPWKEALSPPPANLTLVRNTEAMMFAIVLNGIPGTPMPSHPEMSREVYKGIMMYIEDQPESRKTQWTAFPDLPSTEVETGTAAGEKYFRTYCVGCHGTGGQLTKFGRNEYVWPKPADFSARNSKVGRLYHIISEGLEGTFMPPQKDRIPAVARIALARYVATLFNDASTAVIPIPRKEIPTLKNPFDPKDLTIVSEGETQYNFYCKYCHGDNAKGGFQAPKLTDREWLFGGGSDTAVFTILEEGVPGKLMPAMVNLPNELRWKIITYLRSEGGLPGQPGGQKTGESSEGGLKDAGFRQGRKQ